MPKTNRSSTRVSATRAAVLAAAAAGSAQAFAPAASFGAAPPRALSRPAGRGLAAAPRMAANDEVERLRAAAKKAREEAQALSNELGKDFDVRSDKEKAADREAAVAAAAAAAKDLTAEEAASLSSTVDFNAGNAVEQNMQLDALRDSGDFVLWKSASKDQGLRTYPVTLQFLESRTAGKVNGESLGISGEMDVSLEDFKDATIAVVLGSTALAIGSLALLPENVGASLCYLFALIPVLYIGVGSTAPGIIAGAIAALRGSADEKSQLNDRICRHEAGHFLCGYLCGLPIRSYSADTDSGFPCVEFHPSAEGDASGRELKKEELAALSVVAMSGSVAEALAFGQAKGGGNDLLELEGLFRRSEEFLGAQARQDLTRWGALTAYNLIQKNQDKYEKLVEAFKQKKSVAECVAAIEGR